MTSVWLPKSGVLVCLKTGETLTEDEQEAMDEYFLVLAEQRKGGT